VRIKLRKVFQWIGIFLIAVLGLGILAILALYYTTDQKFLGLKSVVLRNNTQDASNIHERVGTGRGAWPAASREARMGSSSQR
jgi:hypothetical protein